MDNSKIIYLTEEQYVSLVVEMLSSNGMILEGKSLSMLKKVLYHGCRSFKDYARRTIRLAEVGALVGLGGYLTLIKGIPEGSVEEKKELAQEVSRIVEKEPSAETPKTYQYNDYIKQRANSFHISEAGIDHILEYETFRSKPYNATNDEAKRGIFTIGYGHKMSKSEYSAWQKNPYELSKQQARQLFKQDLAAHEADFIDAMNRLPKKYTNPNLYSQGFIDAGVSIVFNAGKGNFMKSDLYKTITKCRIENGSFNKEDYNVLLSKIKRTCITQAGKEVKGLINRRNTEYFMAYDNDYARR